MSSDNFSFKMGLYNGIPIGLGYLSVAFAFGIFATNSGLGILESVFISMFNVTSAGQLAAVPIISSGGSVFELFLTEVVINSRYSLMSVSLSQKFGDSVRLRDRLIFGFMNTDEVFAVAVSKPASVSRKYMYGLIIAPFVGWTVGTLFGAVAGNILPDVLVSSLGIAIYGMFIAILMPEVRREKSTMLAVIAATALSCLFFYLPQLSKIQGGFVIIIVSVLTSLVFALIRPIDNEEEESDV